MELEQADQLAVRYHEGQTDKSGHPYIGHVRRVSESVSGHDEKIVALLHDLLEDTPLTPTDLACAGAPQRVVKAVEALTRSSDEEYLDFVRRAASNPISRVVKIADIADNLNAKRLSLLTRHEAQRLRQKYSAALKILRAAPEPPPDEALSFGDVGMNEGRQLGWVTAYCTDCAHPAGTAELIATDDAGGGASETYLLTFSSFARSQHFLRGEVAQKCLELVKAKKTDALFELDREYAPWWCRECQSSYCGAHWRTEFVFDDGYFEYVSGRCPRGHERILSD